MVALTEGHRLAQLRLGVSLVRRVRLAWPLLDPLNLDGSSERWLRVVVPLVEAQRGLSSTLAAGYYSQLRVSQLGEGFSAVLAGPADIAALTTSLLVTGPVSVKAAMASSRRLSEAVDTAEARTARAAMRHALNGGRETLLQSLKADTQARGWRRVTSGRACDFCSMLASRGGVYSADSADFQAHDGCSCSAEPVWH